MLATSYHNVNMPKLQTSFNPEWTKEHEFITETSRDAFHWFCTLCRCEVYLCIYIIFRSPEMLCFLELCQIICLFMYLFYFQKSRNVMFSGTVHFARQVHLSGQFLKQTSQCLSWISTNTVNKHFFDSSVTHRSTSRYIVDQIVWQWIE